MIASLGQRHQLDGLTLRKDQRNTQQSADQQSPTEQLTVAGATPKQAVLPARPYLLQDAAGGAETFQMLVNQPCRNVAELQVGEALEGVNLGGGRGAPLRHTHTHPGPLAPLTHAALALPEGSRPRRTGLPSPPQTSGLGSPAGGLG